MAGFGFRPERECDGGHTIWVHPDLKQLASRHKIEAPANLASSGKAPWQISLPDNPASGTWDAVVKQAKWCHDKVREIEMGLEHEQQRLKLAREFRKASADYRQWKKDIRHWLRSGLDMQEAPQPPLTFKELMGLKEKSQPSPSRR